MRLMVLLVIVAAGFGCQKQQWQTDVDTLKEFVTFIKASQVDASLEFRLPTNAGAGMKNEFYAGSEGEIKGKLNVRYIDPRILRPSIMPVPIPIE